MNKILTVIIPTYNMETYLRRCLDSLIIDDEGMRLLEVLVINDGSKDSSSAIAHEYQDKYPDTFRVIDKENGNYGSCINRGLKEATGKYVKILDADDWFENHGFILLVRLLGNVDADLILTDFNIQNSSDNSFLSSKYSIMCKDILQNNVFDFQDFLLAHPEFNGVMHGFTYRIDVLKDNDYKQTEGISYTDQEWVALPIKHIRTCCYFPITVYEYFIGREGQTMAPAVMAKSIGQLMKVVINIANAFNFHDFNIQKYSCYIKKQLVTQINIIYSGGLLLMAYPTDILLDFDRQLNRYNQFYDLGDSFKIFHIRYVKYWRLKKGKMLPVLFSFIYKIKSIFKL